MRLYWNELQQAEADSFMGSQRDMLENIHRQVNRADDDLRAHVDQWTTDAGVLEDSFFPVRRLLGSRQVVTRRSFGRPHRWSSFWTK